MCYDVQAQLKTQLKRAIQDQDEVAIQAIEDKMRQAGIVDYYSVSGFAHPLMVIYTNLEPFTPMPAVWGLVPAWVKNEEQKNLLWNTTLNARGETIFEKPSFKESALRKRCLIYIDAFYEHHHIGKDRIPFRIARKDGKPMVLGGLWSDWLDAETGELLRSFSIVTTEGNKLLREIHNNPKLEGPRMPLILRDEVQEKWLASMDGEITEEELKSLILSYPDDDLDSYTVQKLSGKYSEGNSPKAIEPFNHGYLFM